MKTLMPRASASGIELPVPSLSSRRPVVTLWRPEIVLASTVELVRRPKPSPADAVTSPDAVQVQVASAAALTASVAQARRAFGEHAAAALARADEATCDAERVSATFEAYRAEAALDDVLTGTLREVTALLEQRGRR